MLTEALPLAPCLRLQKRLRTGHPTPEQMWIDHPQRKDVKATTVSCGALAIQRMEEREDARKPRLLLARRHSEGLIADSPWDTRPLSSFSQSARILDTLDLVAFVHPQ
jgi:hypothetical protein